jgi:hypothetical protein
MTTTAQPTTPPPTRQVAGFELSLTILGAVCSAVVTGLLAAENVSLTGKLLGMALGAALPPLVGAVGPGRSVRVTAAVLMTAAAVVLAYGGGQLFAKVANTEPPLPTPAEILHPQPTPDPDPDPDPDPGNAIIERSGDLGIRVEPGAITCGADHGCGTATVTSVGTVPLRITSLAFEDDAASYLTATGCENAVLAEDEQCTITLEFTAENAPESATTHLVIHQNLPEVPTLVPLDAEGAVPVEPDLQLGEASCDASALVEDPDAGTVSGELLVQAPLSATGLADLSSVGVAVSVDGVPWDVVDVDPNGGEVAVRNFYAGPRPEQVQVQIETDGSVEQAPDGDEVLAAC